MRSLLLILRTSTRTRSVQQTTEQGTSHSHSVPAQRARTAHRRLVWSEGKSRPIYLLFCLPGPPVGRRDCVVVPSALRGKNTRKT